MRDETIVVDVLDGLLVTVARLIPTSTTIIVRNNNGTIETLSQVKQKESGLLDTEPTIPRIPPDVFTFPGF